METVFCDGMGKQDCISEQSCGKRKTDIPLRNDRFYIERNAVDLLWNRQDKSCACGIFRIKREVTVEATGDAAGDSKADAITVKEAVELCKWLKDLLCIFGRNTRTGILDDELDL